MMRKDKKQQMPLRLQRHSRLWFVGTFIAAVVLLSELFTPAPLSGATGTTPGASATSTQQSEIVIQVPLPIMKKGNCTDKYHVNKLGEPLTCVESYGEYVGLIYRYFSGVIGILAAVMLMWGGFRWMAAAGNTSRVESAKETIYSSIIALVIVLGSYVILYTINPQLTNLTLYGVNPINPIEQPFALCSNNAPALIDLKSSGCKPDNEDCCGREFKIKDDPTITCSWDTAYDENSICVSLNNQRRQSIVVYDYCVDYATGNKRNFCPTADLKIQQAKQWDAREQKFKKKFTRTGCRFQDVPSFVRVDPVGKDKCVWSYLLSALPQTIIDKDIIDKGYEAQPVSCTEPGAEGVCWYKDDKGVVRGRDCTNLLETAVEKRSVFCKNPDDKRSVAGADGWCLVKKDKRGSTVKSDYTCWAPPDYKDVSKPF